MQCVHIPFEQISVQGRLHAMGKCSRRLRSSHTLLYILRLGPRMEVHPLAARSREFLVTRHPLFDRVSGFQPFLVEDSRVFHRTSAAYDMIG